MELEGIIWKEGKYWIVEVPSLNVSTQGKTRKDALLMIKDAVLELMKSYFDILNDEFEISVTEYNRNTFGLKADNDNKLLFSFLLIRQREESGLTIREVSKRLHVKSPNSYAQYEKGRISFSIDQFEKLMQAINPHRTSLLRMI